MKEVRDRLYIGNITDASMVLSTSNHEITHILSLVSSSMLSSFNSSKMSSALERKSDYSGIKLGKELVSCTAKVDDQLSKVVRMFVLWEDTVEQVILDDLVPCLDFIEKGRLEGKVLVHCLAGVSRSAAVLSAYLMKTEQLPLEGEAYRSGQKIEMSRFAVDPVETSNLMVKLENQISNFNLPQHSQERHSASYRCKRCRRILAVESNVLLHSPGKGDVSFRRKKRDKSLFDEEREPGCTSIFVEPMQWMNTVQEGVVMGKLSCPNCRARLGTFNWAGMQCSCGSWVIPAFQLHKSRMDMENL
eukprot:c27142_g1_i4 orf=512-1420(+)